MTQGTELWGHNYTRRELESLVGDLRQIADIELITLGDGPGQGSRVARARTGGGLSFDICLDRGLDLGNATFRDIPLTWYGPPGPSHPHRAESSGMGWLRTFSGGLLSLCGLTNAGPPSRDVVTGEEIGLHGRISAAQAREVAIESLWKGNEWTLRLRGVVDDAALFRHKLRLERTIEITPGQPGFQLTDRIRNCGGDRAPLMLLYHCNFGWPLLGASTVLESPALKVVPRDEAAAAGTQQWSRFAPPQANFREQVYFHELPPTTDCRVCVVNPDLGIRVELSFNSAELDHLTQWKLPAFGDYVLGVEPGNCPPIGQQAADRIGELPWLQPGEEKVVHLGFRCLSEG